MSGEYDFELHGFPPALGHTSASPFVVKSLVQSGLAGARVKFNPQGDVRAAPNNKLPFIELPDSSKVADSEFIYQYLCENFSLDLDGHLTDEQQAQGYLLARAFEEHLYFVNVTHRWRVDENWAITRKAYFAKMLPPVIRTMLAPVIRRSVLGSLKGQGMGRHSIADAYQFGSKMLMSFGILLGDQDYLFGSRISYADTCIGPQISGTTGGGLNSPMDEVFSQYPNLARYAKRVCDNADTAIVAEPDSA